MKYRILGVLATIVSMVICALLINLIRLLFGGLNEIIQTIAMLISAFISITVGKMTYIYLKNRQSNNV
jgi:putative flippase GtrA